jgi:predicted AAA+ superfamily ATPase
MGARLETAAYLELRRRGYEVAVGAMPNGEVDFVARRPGEQMYVQVTQSLLDERTRERELAPLRRLTDAYPRLVLTADSLTTGVTKEGIRIRNIEEWLLADSVANGE